MRLAVRVALLVAGALAAGVAAVALFIWWGTRDFHKDDGKPCDRFAHDLRPLLVGQDVPLAVGRRRGSDCIRSDDRVDTWSSSAPGVATVTPQGVARGIAPGRFVVRVVVDGIDLEAPAFVLPPGFQVRIEPAQIATVVGTAFTVRVRAHAQDGALLPAVPAQVALERWGAADAGADELIVDRWWQRGEDGVVSFTARRPGRTRLIATIGNVTAELPLDIAEGGDGARPPP